jgi:hypothetical protein
MALAASPGVPIEIASAEMVFSLYMSNHGLDGGAAERLALDGPNHSER